MQYCNAICKRRGKYGGKGRVYQGNTKVVETVLQCKERRVVPIQGGTKVVVPIQGGTKVVPTQGISSADLSCKFGRLEATRGAGTIVDANTLLLSQLSTFCLQW